MKAKNKNGKVPKTTTYSKEYRIKTNNLILDRYWDDGWPYHKSKGNRNKKQILSYQVRQYKTWKYNRKQQYKEDS